MTLLNSINKTNSLGQGFIRNLKKRYKRQKALFIFSFITFCRLYRFCRSNETHKSYMLATGDLVWQYLFARLYKAELTQISELRLFDYRTFEIDSR